MGTALGGGVGPGNPLQPSGGGGLGHPLPSTLIGKPFSHCGAKRPKLFLALSNQPKTQNEFELSNCKIFFDAHRQSGKNTLIYGPMG